MKEAPHELITVTVAGKSVCLDPNNMKFNENTLAEYMSREYSWCDYFGKQLEIAQKEMLLAEIDAEAQYSLKFITSKDLGNSDNHAKAYANSHVDVVAAKKKVADHKETVGHLKSHLKAWTISHENAQNRGHTLRKEMDKLNLSFLPDADDKTCSAEDFTGG